MTNQDPQQIRTLAILRGCAADLAGDLAQRCWDAGIDLVEVPVQNDESWRALDAVLARSDGRLVGAGTVIDTTRAHRAIAAGVGVLITPGLDESVVEAAKAADVAILPGVMSPSEVQHGMRLGLKALKLFPIGALGTDYLRALRPVFPETAFVVTGGVSPANAEELVVAGANALAFGGRLESVLADDHVMAVAAQIERPWSLRA